MTKRRDSARATRRTRGAQAAEREKTCVICGRRVTWRRSLAADWANVRRCSAACRKRRLTATDRALEDAIRTLLDARRRGATVCPSEVARTVRPEGWRALLPRARDAARRLVAAGEVEITQGGEVVAPSTARGPIRLRRRKRGEP